MKKRGAFTVHDHDLATQDLTGQTYNFDSYAKNIETAIVAGPLFPSVTEDMLPADIGRRVSMMVHPTLGYVLRKGGVERNILLYAKYDGQRMKDIYFARVVCGRIRPHIPVAVGKFAHFTSMGPFIKSSVRTPYIIGNNDIIHEWAMPRIPYFRQGIFSKDVGFAEFGDDLSAVFEIFCVSTDSTKNTGGTIEKNGAEAILTFTERQVQTPVVIVSARKEGGGNYFAYTEEVTKKQAKIKVRNELGADVDLTDIVISATGLLFTAEDFAPQATTTLTVNKDEYEVVVGEVLNANIKANDSGSYIWIYKVNNSEALVGTEWTHPQGGKITVKQNGDLTFDSRNDPNFADIFGTRTKTILFTYFVKNDQDQEADSFVAIKVKAAPITVIVDGPFEVTTTQQTTFNLLTASNNPNGVIRVLNAFGGQSLTNGAVAATIPNGNNINMDITVNEDGTVTYNPVQIDTILNPGGFIDTVIDVTFSDGNTEYATAFTIRQKRLSGTIIIEAIAVADNFGIITSDTVKNVLSNDTGHELEVFKVNDSEANVGVFVSATPSGTKIKIDADGTTHFDITDVAANYFDYNTLNEQVSYAIRVRTHPAVTATATVTYQFKGTKVRVVANHEQVEANVSDTSVSWNVLANDTGRNIKVIEVDGDAANVGRRRSIRFFYGIYYTSYADVTIMENGDVIFNPSELSGISIQHFARIDYTISDGTDTDSTTLFITVNP